MTKKIETMTDEQANTFFSFFIKIKVLDPIQTILHKLENCEYRDVDVKWLNHQMIKFSNLAMDIMGHKEHLIKTDEIVINGVINSYNYKRFRDNFIILKDFFERYSDN